MLTNAVIDSASGLDRYWSDAAARFGLDERGRADLAAYLARTAACERPERTAQVLAASVLPRLQSYRQQHRDDVDLVIADTGADHVDVRDGAIAVTLQRRGRRATLTADGTGKVRVEVIESAARSAYAGSLGVPARLRAVRAAAVALERRSDDGFLRRTIDSAQLVQLWHDRWVAWSTA